MLAVLVYTAARVGAVAKLTLKSLKHDGAQYTLRFAEKGGKSREIPVRHDLVGPEESNARNSGRLVSWD